MAEKKRGGLPSWDTLSQAEQEKKKKELREALLKGRVARKEKDAAYALKPKKAIVRIDLRNYIGKSTIVNSHYVKKKFDELVAPMLKEAVKHAKGKNRDVVKSQDWAVGGNAVAREERRKYSAEAKIAKKIAYFEAKKAAAQAKFNAQVQALKATK